MSRPFSPRFAQTMLIVSGLIAYANCYPKAFVFDDEDWISRADFGDFFAYVASYPTRPLLMLSNWVIHQIGAYNPVPHHVLNVVIHIGATLLLFGLVWRTLRLPYFHARYRHSATRYAFAVALLWQVHPIQTQSVTYIIQRGESMAGLFYLGTIYTLLRSQTSWHHPGAWSVVSLACLFLGFCSKEIMMTAPGAALLYDRIFLSSTVRELVRKRWRYYAAFLAIWAGFVGWHLTRALAVDKGIGFGMEAVGPKQYALTECGVLLYYLRLSVLPIGQSIDYQGWPWCYTVNDAMPELAIVAGLLLATAILLWKRPAIGFVMAWFFLILIPTSSFLPIVDPVYEHRLYLSLASVCIGVVWVGDWFLREQTKMKAVLLILTVCVLTLLTLRRNEDYRSIATIWQSALEVRPDNPRAAFNLAHGLMMEDRPEEALNVLLDLEKRLPNNPMVREHIEIARSMGKAKK